MLGLWLLMMVVMVNLYGSTVTSYFTVNKLKPIPTSLEELAATIGQQRCLLTLQKQHPVLALVQVPYVLLEYSFTLYKKNYLKTFEAVSIVTLDVI